MEFKRFISDEELVREGSRYRFHNKDEKILILTKEQIEKARKEMKKSLGEEEPTQEDLGKPKARTEEVNGKTLGRREFKYNKKGQVVMETFTRAETKTEERDAPDYSIKTTYGPNEKEFHKEIKYFKDGKSYNIQKHFDENGNLMGKEWEIRKEGTSSSYRGQVVYKNRVDENGRIIERIGKITAPQYYGTEVNKYSYDENERLLAWKQDITKNHHSGKLKGKEVTENYLHFEDYDMSGNLKMRGRRYKDQRNSNVEETELFSYDKGENLVGKKKIISVDEKDKFFFYDYQLEREQE